jgi:hypothetical protein
MISPYNLFDPSHSSTFQANFNAVGMGWGFGQDIFDNPFCEFSRSLILLEDDEYPKADLNFTPIHTVHDCFLFRAVLKD